MVRDARRLIDTLAWLASLVVFAVILLASMSKLLTMEDFIRDLAVWQLIPESIAPLLAAAVVTVELALPTLWLLYHQSKWPVLIAGLLLVCFTVIYLIESLINSPPNCSCFGKIVQFHQHDTRLATLIIRNGILIGLLASSLLITAMGRTSEGGN